LASVAIGSASTDLVSCALGWRGAPAILLNSTRWAGVASSIVHDFGTSAFAYVTSEKLLLHLSITCFDSFLGNLVGVVDEILNANGHVTCISCKIIVFSVQVLMALLVHNDLHVIGNDDCTQMIDLVEVMARDQFIKFKWVETILVRWHLFILIITQHDVFCSTDWVWSPIDYHRLKVHMFPVEEVYLRILKFHFI
jgi:hypothetical protein